MSAKPEAVLDRLIAGEIERDEALKLLEDARVEELGFARIDHDRARRRGFPEVIYGAGKTPEQIGEIFERLAARSPNVLATRVCAEAVEAVRARVPEAEDDPKASCVWVHRDREITGQGQVLVVSAGTSDQRTAREAFVTARVMGQDTDLIEDVGVAGLHRVVGELDRIRAARVLIVVAGMEGALPSVVAGLVDRPVIAVPTSAGYGAAFGGLAALLGMLNSCPGGVTVVNIDNGFGAAFAATMMNRP